MPGSLQIDDADDLVDLRRDLERVSATRFTNAEAAACRTVGDLLDLVRKHRPPQPGPDPAALVLAQLRTALPHGTDDTPLRRYLGTSPRRSLAALTPRTGLQMPKCRLSRPGQIGLAALPAALLWFWTTALVAPAWWWTALPLAIAGAALLRLDPGRPPPDLDTLADLARHITRLNLGRLHEAGANIDEAMLQASLHDCLARFTPRPKAEMHPTTPIASAVPPPPA